MNVLQFLAQLFAGQAINSLVLGIGVALLTALAMLVFPKQNSGARFSILYSALLVIVVGFFLFGGEDAVAVNRHGAEIVVSARWATYLFAVWAVMAMIGITRIAVGLWHLAGIRRSFVPLSDSELARIAGPKGFRSQRQARICVSDKVRVPAAVGFFRPVVILPKWALNDLSAEELRAAILHELAHVDRWDDWTNLLQKFIRAVFFFHPAVWWIDSRLATEREMCCDDAVLASVSEPRHYAECLVALAEKSVVRRSLMLAQAAVGRVKQTALRVSRILDSKKNDRARGWKPALATIAVISVLGLAGIEHTPKLVAFEDTETTPVISASGIPQPPAMAIPASMRFDPATKQTQRTSLPSKHVNKRPVTRPAEDQVIAATEPRPGFRNPVVVNAAAKDQATPEFMMVVFQTRAYDAFGNVTVTTTVWRVQLKSSGARIEGMAPHST